MYMFRYSADRSYAMLVEMPAREARRALAGVHPECARFVFEKTDAAHAHRWVRQDGVHATALYLDRGRIRRAG